MRAGTLFALICLTAGTSIAGQSIAEEQQPLDAWIFPGAKAVEKTTSTFTIAPADKTNVRSYAPTSGQFLTDKSFREVVAFYVEKSGLTPPNWSILGREFPGTEVFIPAHFIRTNAYGENPSVTILHNIREEAASLHLLVTQHPELGNVTIAVTRAKDDEQTLIQLIHHPNPLSKGTEQPKGTPDESKTRP